MKDHLRFGIIGCGAVSVQYHLPAIVKSRLIKLVAAVDSDLAWARSVAGRFGASFVSASYRDLPGRVDAALIATPNSTHAEICCYLLEHGVHVLCEKPMATTVRDARRMLATAQTNYGRLMIGHTLRFSPQLKFLQQLLTSGFLDRTGILSASLSTPHGSWPTRTDFRLKRELAGGGVMMDLGVHLIDLAIWLFDDRPQQVEYYQTQGRGWGIEDDAELKLSFRRGGSSQLAVSYTHGMDGVLEYRGLEGWVKTGLHSTLLEFYLNHSRVCRVSGIQQPVLDPINSYEAQLEHFCLNVNSGEPFLVRTDQVILGLELIEACYAHPGDFLLDPT